jgi:TnsA endonuclease N terminal
MAVRKITNKGCKKIIGKFPSLKMGRLIWWESQIERDYIYLLELDPAVISYEEQPIRISYHLSGKKRHYTPDFLVRKADRNLIVEVKREEEALKEENQRLFNIVGAICARDGYEFIVVTDKMIRVQPRLYNIKLLTRYQRTPIHDPHYQIVCYELFSKKPKASLSEVIRFFASRGIGKQVIFSLLYWGVLAVDLMQSIEVESVVYMPALKTER